MNKNVIITLKLSLVSDESLHYFGGL